MRVITYKRWSLKLSKSALVMEITVLSSSTLYDILGGYSSACSLAQTLLRRGCGAATVLSETGLPIERRLNKVCDTLQAGFIVSYLTELA